jgi:signal transduction histidine kinase
VKVLVSSDESADHVKVTIADRGPGVSEADRARLFARFSRGAESGSGEGTGLGLYVSRQLLRAMGGDLWLDPAVAETGASFTLTLPGERPGDGN